jgi:hypothetical protein
MSLIEPFLQQVLLELDAFTNWRHYKYLNFKAGRVTCGWGHASGVTTTKRALSAFPLVLVTDGRRGKMEGRGHSPQGGVFLLGHQ